MFKLARCRGGTILLPLPKTITSLSISYQIAPIINVHSTVNIVVLFLLKKFMMIINFDPYKIIAMIFSVDTVYHVHHKKKSIILISA